MENTIIDSIDLSTLIGKINQAMQPLAVEANGADGGQQHRGVYPWSGIIAKIEDFSALEADWDGQGAKAPDPVLVESAILFAQLCRQGGMAAPAVVVPGLDGCVIFDWQMADVYMEVEICKPRYGEFMKVIFDRPPEHKVITF